MDEESLLWLKENDPDAYWRTATWLNVADYMAFRLRGVAATDFSLASRTLVLDLHALRWADGLLEEVGISPDLFAPLPGGSFLGPVTPDAASATGLPESTSVAAGGRDHVCGTLAVGVTQKGTMLNSLGTAEANFLPLERPLTNPGSVIKVTPREPTWRASTTSSAASTPRAPASNGCERPLAGSTTTP